MLAGLLELHLAVQIPFAFQCAYFADVYILYTHMHMYICICILYMCIHRKEQTPTKLKKRSTQHTELNTRTEHCFIVCAPSNLYQLNKNTDERTACLLAWLSSSFAFVCLLVCSFVCSFARSVSRLAQIVVSNSLLFVLLLCIVVGHSFLCFFLFISFLFSFQWASERARD